MPDRNPFPLSLDDESELVVMWTRRGSERMTAGQAQALAGELGAAAAKLRGKVAMKRLRAARDRGVPSGQGGGP